MVDKNEFLKANVVKGILIEKKRSRNKRINQKRSRF